MKVFSNTTPFIALSSIGRLDLLPALFQTIHVCESVVAECRAGGGIPVPDLSGLEWTRPMRFKPLPGLPMIMELDQGERDTILAALQERADLVLIDERLGRNIAEYYGLRITGTLGVLLRAKKEGMIDSFRQSVLDMQRQGIRYSQALVEKLCHRIGE
jgi:uncharacterized protein